MKRLFYMLLSLLLQGRKWWMNTDEPWQTLACCMEIAKATRAPDPAVYISHFPVHQVGRRDGSPLHSFFFLLFGHWWLEWSNVSSEIWKKNSGGLIVIHGKLGNQPPGLLGSAGAWTSPQWVTKQRTGVTKSACLCPVQSASQSHRMEEEGRKYWDCHMTD